MLSPEVDERLLALVAGAVVSHPLNGGTEVAVPTTGRNVLQVADDLARVATHLWGIAGVDPVALSLDPVALSWTRSRCRSTRSRTDALRFQMVWHPEPSGELKAHAVSLCPPTLENPEGYHRLVGGAAGLAARLRA